MWNIRTSRPNGILGKQLHRPTTQNNISNVQSVIQGCERKTKLDEKKNDIACVYLDKAASSTVREKIYIYLST